MIKQRKFCTKLFSLHQNLKTPIVGKRGEISSTETIEFFKDGTVIVFNQGMTMDPVITPLRVDIF